MGKADFTFRYKVRNWSEYNRALVRRGQLMGQAILDLIKHPADRQNLIDSLLQIALNYAGRRPHLVGEILVNVPIVMPLMRFTSR